MSYCNNIQILFCLLPCLFLFSPTNVTSCWEFSSHSPHSRTSHSHSQFIHGNSFSLTEEQCKAILCSESKYLMNLNLYDYDGSTPDEWPDRANEALVVLLNSLEEVKKCLTYDVGLNRLDMKNTFLSYVNDQIEKVNEKFCPTLITWKILAIVFMTISGLMAILLGVSAYFLMAR